MIANYTTTVPVDRSITEITRQLTKAGAHRIVSDFDADGRHTGLSFMITVPYGDGVSVERAYTLPARIERVRAVLVRQRVQPRYRTPEHAGRVAWAILRDWVRAQLAIIQTQMITLDEVLLPYRVMEGGATLYEQITELDRRQIGSRP